MREHERSGYRISKSPLYELIPVFLLSAAIFLPSLYCFLTPLWPCEKDWTTST